MATSTGITETCLMGGKKPCFTCEAGSRSCQERIKLDYLEKFLLTSAHSSAGHVSSGVATPSDRDLSHLLREMQNDRIESIQTGSPTYSSVWSKAFLALAIVEKGIRNCEDAMYRCGSESP